MQDLFVASRLGRVHIRAAGEGPLLFLMHSAGRSAYEFDALAVLLADRFRVVAWDMPGHGDSDRLVRHVSILEFGDLAVEVAKSLAGDEPVILGGGSVGAAIALAAAAVHGDRLAGVVPIELPLSRDAGWWRSHWPMIETMFACPDEPEERARSRFRSWSPEFALRLRVDRHKAGSRGMMQLLWAGREDADATQGRIAGLRVPALMINGSAGVSPEATDLLPRLNPDVSLAVIPDSGHFPHTDFPEAVAEAIRMAGMSND